MIGEFQVLMYVCMYLLFMSTIAKLAPLITMPWPITRPRPLAPPVTTPTLPSNEKEARVRFICWPPRPWTGTEGGSSPSSGYSTVMDSSVRAKPPGTGEPPLGGSAKGRVVCRKAAVLGRGAAARRVRDAAAEVRRKERDNMMARCAIIKGYN